MKTVFAALLLASQAFAAPLFSVAEEDSKLSLANVESVEKVYDKNDDIARVVVLENGFGTDLSPRFEIYITVYSFGEMSNVWSVFRIGYAYDIESIKTRKDGTLSVVAVDDYNGEGFVSSQYDIDLTQALKEAHEVDRGDFNDTYFKSAIEVKKTAK